MRVIGAVVLGAAILAAVDRDRFYMMAQQRDGAAGRIAAAFCASLSALLRLARKLSESTT